MTQEQLVPAYTEFQCFPTILTLLSPCLLRTPGLNQHLLSQRLLSSHPSLQQYYESYWVVSKTPSETNHFRKITAQIPRAVKNRFPAAHTNNLNEAESNAFYNTNSGWKKRSTDCGKVPLNKQTPQAPVQQESKQGSLNTELNFKFTVPLFLTIIICSVKNRHFQVLSHSEWPTAGTALLT